MIKLMEVEELETGKKEGGVLGKGIAAALKADSMLALIIMGIYQEGEILSKELERGDVAGMHGEEIRMQLR